MTSNSNENIIMYLLLQLSAEERWDNTFRIITHHKIITGNRWSHNTESQNDILYNI